MSKSKNSGGIKLPVLGHKEVRLINILAELCACDPADIFWDGSGSADTVVFFFTNRLLTPRGKPLVNVAFSSSYWAPRMVTPLASLPMQNTLR